MAKKIKNWEDIHTFEDYHNATKTAKRLYNVMQHSKMMFNTLNFAN